MGFAILSGAGLLTPTEAKPAHVHMSVTAELDTDGVIDLSEQLDDETIDDNSPVFVMGMEHGSLTNMMSVFTVDTATKKKLTTTTHPDVVTQVFVDFYTTKTSGMKELQIDAGSFAGYYYVEASTLFKRQSDGEDLPAELIFPNVKIQSNFTFSMASTGDPSGLMRLAA